MAIHAAENVNSIPSNKNTGKPNYNSGVVALACYINYYCPMSKKYNIDDTIIVNYDTIKSENVVKNNIRKYSEDIVNSITGVSLEYNKDACYDNFIYAYDNIGDNYTVLWDKEEEKDKDRDEKDALKGELRFDAVESFLGSNTGPETIAMVGSCATSGAKVGVPLWKGSLIQCYNVTTEDNSMAYSMNQLRIGTETYPVHWRIEKNKKLFAGQDFKINFKSTSFDIKTFENKTNKEKSFKNSGVFPSLSCIDTTNKEKVSVKLNKKSVDIPKNIGIKKYTLEKGKYIDVVDELETSYNFNVSPYFIVENGPDEHGETLFFIFTVDKLLVIKCLSNGVGLRVTEQPLKEKFFGFGSNLNKDIVFQNVGSFMLLSINSFSYIIKAPEESVYEYYRGSKYPSDNVLKICDAKLIMSGGWVACSINFSPLFYMKEGSLVLPEMEKSQVGKTTTYTPKTYRLPKDGFKKVGIDPSITGNKTDIGKNKPIYTHICNYIKTTNLISGSTDEIKIKPYTSDKNITSGDDVVNSAGLEFNIIEQEDDSKDDNTHFKFVLVANLNPGDQSLSTGTSSSKNDGDAKDKAFKAVFKSCKTPYLGSFRLSSSDAPAKPLWEANGFEASELVMRFSENYSAEDFHTMNHTGSIVFLLNKGLSKGLDSVREKLESLINKAFYIDVYVGYNGCNYSQLNSKNGYKLFTGICYGGTVNEKAGERTLTCNISDYSKILQETLIFNSPFFDGVRDWCAIYNLLRIADMRDDNEGRPGPAYLCKLQNDSTTQPFVSQTSDGRGSWSTLWTLPTSYDRFREPFFKFQDSSTIWNAIQSISKKAGKVIFFDSYGVFHYEQLPYDSYMYNGGQSKDDVKSLWKYTRSPFNDGQLIFDYMSREISVTDIYNSFLGITTNPNRELFIMDVTNKDSIDKPSSPGFLGYKKVLFQQEALFGSMESFMKAFENYKKFWHAPIVYKWQSYGLPIRVFDIAEIDGQKMIITNVSTEIDASKNIWWQNIEGEWYGSEETLKEV